MRFLFLFLLRLVSAYAFRDMMVCRYTVIDSQPRINKANFLRARIDSRRWMTNSDKENEEIDDDEIFVEAFKARVEELGGETGVKQKVLKNDVRRAADTLVEKTSQTGKGIRKFLDLENKQSREPLDSNAGFDFGWPLTLATLGLIVLLAILQSSRIDPSNY